MVAIICLVISIGILLFKVSYSPSYIDQFLVVSGATSEIFFETPHEEKTIEEILLKIEKI